eukprot:1752516-Rhodomonas_salina.1
MNPHDPRGNMSMNAPFAPGFQDQRSLSEQIHQTHQHLVQLHSLSSGAALEAQQHIGVPHAGGFQQQRMAERSSSSWATPDPQLLHLIQSAGFDAREKGPSSGENTIRISKGPRREDPLCRSAANDL